MAEASSAYPVDKKWVATSKMEDDMGYRTCMTVIQCRVIYKPRRGKQYGSKRSSARES